MTLLTEEEYLKIGIELVRAVGRGSPAHHELRKDIERAVWVSFNSPLFREIMVRNPTLSLGKVVNLANAAADVSSPTDAARQRDVDLIAAFHALRKEATRLEAEIRQDGYPASQRVRSKAAQAKEYWRLANVVDCARIALNKKQCSDGHDEISYADGGCPLCDIQGALTEYYQEIERTSAVLLNDPGPDSESFSTISEHAAHIIKRLAAAEQENAALKSTSRRLSAFLELLAKQSLPAAYEAERVVLLQYLKALGIPRWYAPTYQEIEKEVRALSVVRCGNCGATYNRKDAGAEEQHGVNTCNTPATRRPI